MPDAKVDTLLDGMHAVLSDDDVARAHGGGRTEASAAYDWRLVTRQYLDLLIPIAERAAREGWQ